MKKLVLGLAAAAVICMVAAPAIAATEWNFGASLRYETFWSQRDAGKGQISDIQGGGARLDKDAELKWGTQGNSRIKMFMKGDNLEGFIEFGYNFDTNAVTTREYWGKYKFNNDVSITIGQAHQLFNIPGFSGQAWGGDLNLVGTGISFVPPTPKIILGFGGFSFALAKYDAGKPSILGYSTNYNNYAVNYTTDIDTYLPQLQASYQYRGDSWMFKLGGAFQHYKLKKISGTITETPVGGGTATNYPFDISNKNIISWLIDLKAQVDFGPLYIKGAGSVGQNWANAGWNSNRGGLNYLNDNKKLASLGLQVNQNGKVKDTFSIMAAAIAGYRLTESLRFEAGAGYRYDDNDAWKDSSTIFNVYVQAVYTVAPGFSITPEIGYIDLGKSIDRTSRQDVGYIWYAGAKWQMDF